MHTTVRIAVLVSLATLCAWGPYAQGQPDAAAGSAAASDAFAAASAAFAEEEFELALHHFQNALETGVTGPAIHYNLGVCFYRLGRYDEAAAQFALIAERYPQMRGLAQYNLGLTVQKQGDNARARVHFQHALDASDDEAVQELARLQLEQAGAEGYADADTYADTADTADTAAAAADTAAYTAADTDTDADADAPSPQPSWLAIVDARLGYDDNVLLLADEIQLPDGQSAESGFIEAWAVVSRPPSSAAGFRLDGSFFVLRYPEASIFDQSVLDFSAAYQWQWRQWRAEAGPRAGWTTIDGDLLDQRIGAGVRLTRDLGERLSLVIRYEHDEIDEGRSRFVFFSGERDRAELRLDHFGSRTRLTVSYEHERNDRVSATVSPRRNKLSLRYRARVGPSWLLDARGSIRDSRYRGLSLERGERLEELSLGITRLLPEDWQINGEMSVADNGSDVRTFEYRRNRVSLGVSKQF